MNAPSKLVLFFLVVISTAARAEVDFVHQVVPVLKKHCAECHADEEAEGGFSINTRELFLDDNSAEPGNSEKSYFIELILDDDPDYQMPPEKKDRVSPAEVALLKQWVDEGMKWEPGFSFGEPTYEPPLKPRFPELPPAKEGRENPVDRIIDQYLSDNKLPTPEPIDDLTFLRRVSLDLIGLPPTATEALAFQQDSSPDKRAKEIEALLADNIGYTDHWLTFWNDLLRNDYSGTGFITKGRTQISSWLYDALKTNMPFDQMITELIAPPTVESAGFINGIKWRGTVSAGQTLPIQFSQSISQSFLGINMKCASCHDSFVDRWKLNDAYALAAVFSEEELEIHRCDKPVGETAKAGWLFPEIGEIDPEASKEVRLAQLADLMTHPENGRVTRTITNRIWGQLMGRGIVHPLDAMQTEPWNEDLLDFLAADFQEHGYDIKHTIRTIVSSHAYQSETEKLEEQPTGEYTYGGPRAKRLTAEQFTDAIWKITGSAPGSFDAPVIRGIATTEEIASLEVGSQWIWKASAKDSVPKAGEQVLLRKDFTPKGAVKSAAIIAAADNSYELVINRKPVISGSKWNQLQSKPAKPFLRNGVNRIMILAKNGGKTDNPAGAFAALHIVYVDGKSETISTDETWQAAASIPKQFSQQQWKFEELEWEPVHPTTLPIWTEAIDPETGAALAKAAASSPNMVRAALLKSDFLMRSLGRPNRDQIVTSRPNELTTLEAIDLSNSETLAGYLSAGAKTLAGRDWKSGDELINHLFLSALTRLPSEEEKELFQEIGENPNEESVSDALWALTLTPEFLFIR